MASLVLTFIKYPSFMFSVIFVQISSSFAKNAVPLILWTQRLEKSFSDPFHETSKEHFRAQLDGILNNEKPPLLLFVKEDICIEDLQHNKENLGWLDNSLPSIQWTAVNSPLSILESLPSYNVTLDDNFESISDNQLIEVPLSDLEVIKDVYNRIRRPNLIIGLTGKFCRYLSLDRTKRANAVGSAEPLVVLYNKKILLFADQKPLLKIKNGDHTLQLRQEAVSMEMSDKTRNLSMTFVATGQKQIFLKAQFDTRGDGYEFVGFHFQDENNAMGVLLKSRNEILILNNSSYHCSRQTFFAHRNENMGGPISLTLSNFQVQMDTDSFGRVFDCTGFMSIPIWTGIFVTVILAMIIIWGLTMMMDIRTMDRFDDPKGKTIAISAQE